MTNQKQYIGQTVNPSKRWHDHRRQASCPKQVLHTAIAKYGAYNFTFEVIASCRNRDDANETEKACIKQYGSLADGGHGYNINEGGSNDLVGRVTPEKVRKKQSLAKLGKKHSEETKQKLSALATGRKHRPESIQKMRNRVFTSEHRERLSDSFKPHYKVSPDQYEALISDYQQLSVKEVAEKYGVSEKAVYEITRDFRQAESITRRVKIKPEQYLNVVAHYEKLKSTRKVAELYGVAKTTICKILRLTKVEV